MESTPINASSGGVNTIQRTLSPTPPTAEPEQAKIVDTANPLRAPEMEPSPETLNPSLNSSSGPMPSSSGEPASEVLDSRKRIFSEDTGSPQRTSKLPRIMNNGIGEKADASWPVIEHAVMGIPRDRSSSSLVPVKLEDPQPYLSQPCTSTTLGPYARLYEIRESRYYCLIC